MAAHPTVRIVEREDVIAEQRGTAPQALGREACLTATADGHERDDPGRSLDRTGMQELEASQQADGPQDGVEQDSLPREVIAGGSGAAQHAPIGREMKQGPRSIIEEEVTGAALQRRVAAAIEGLAVGDRSLLFGQRFEGLLAHLHECQLMSG